MLVGDGGLSVLPAAAAATSEASSPGPAPARAERLMIPFALNPAGGPPHGLSGGGAVGGGGGGAGDPDRLEDGDDARGVIGEL